MANDRPTLYIGMTNNLPTRVQQHKSSLVEGFTKRYHLHKLVYFELFPDALSAIIREKQMKDMDRKEKLAMIKKVNPDLTDLSVDL